MPASLNRTIASKNGSCATDIQVYYICVMQKFHMKEIYHIPQKNVSFCIKTTNNLHLINFISSPQEGAVTTHTNLTVSTDDLVYVKLLGISLTTFILHNYTLTIFACYILKQIQDAILFPQTAVPTPRWSKYQKNKFAHLMKRIYIYV